jgi:hypothetical protein
MIHISIVENDKRIENKGIIDWHGLCCYEEVLRYVALELSSGVIRFRGCIVAGPWFRSQISLPPCLFAMRLSRRDHGSPL